MTECPLLTQLSENAIIVTADQIRFLIVDTYSRGVGTTVNVRCQPGLVLEGPSTVRCMQSGYWSADPYCRFPEVETTATSPTSGMDESMILVTVLAVVGFLVAALIVFVCVAMYWGRKHRKKIKHYRDGSDFYMEEVSSQPYSNMSRKKPEDMRVYNTNVSQMPTSYSQEHLAHHRQLQQREVGKVHHTAYDGNHDRHRHHSPDGRHFRYKCPYCVQRYDAMRHAHSANDVLDEIQREYRTEEEDGDKPIRDRRRDAYLWRSRSSFSDLNIPRPYYEMSGLPHYIAYYGPSIAADI